MKRVAHALIVFFFALSISATAQVKFAVVDMQKVAKQYNETKEIEKLLQQDNDAFVKELELRGQELKNLSEEIQKLMSEATSQSLTEEVRAQKRKDAEIKSAQFQRARQEGQAFEVQRRRGLNQKRQRLLRNISEDIKLVVDRIGKRDNFNFIFNSTGLGAPLYQQGVVDMTDQVIKDLNGAQ